MHFSPEMSLLADGQRGFGRNSYGATSEITRKSGIPVSSHTFERDSSWNGTAGTPLPSRWDMNGAIFRPTLIVR